MSIHLIVFFLICILSATTSGVPWNISPPKSPILWSVVDVDWTTRNKNVDDVVVSSSSNTDSISPPPYDHLASTTTSMPSKENMVDDSTTVAGAATTRESSLPDVIILPDSSVVKVDEVKKGTTPTSQPELVENEPVIAASDGSENQKPPESATPAVESTTTATVPPPVLEVQEALRTEPTPEPPSDAMPSFDEWKKIRLAEQQQIVDLEWSNGAKGGHYDSDVPKGSAAAVSAGEQTVPSSQVAAPSSQRVQVKRRRRNYASYECGAKLLAANPEADGAGRVLNDQLDEYMLNPCRANIWFIVELCESVQPSDIEIANFELFSSMPKEFAVYGSHDYHTKNWTPLGKFQAEDLRDIQNFKLISHAPYGKYLKVEFLSNYGTEHYCPLSLVRLYGTSMVDDYELLASDGDEKQEEEAEVVEVPVPVANETEKPDVMTRAKDALKTLFHHVIKPGSVNVPAVENETITFDAFVAVNASTNATYIDGNELCSFVQHGWIDSMFYECMANASMQRGNVSLNRPLCMFYRALVWKDYSKPSVLPSITETTETSSKPSNVELESSDAVTNSDSSTVATQDDNASSQVSEQSTSETQSSVVKESSSVTVSIENEASADDNVTSATTTDTTTGATEMNETSLNSEIQPSGVLFEAILSSDHSSATVMPTDALKADVESQSSQLDSAVQPSVKSDVMTGSEDSAPAVNEDVNVETKSNVDAAVTTTSESNMQSTAELSQASVSIEQPAPTPAEQASSTPTVHANTVAQPQLQEQHIKVEGNNNDKQEQQPPIVAQQQNGGHTQQQQQQKPSTQQPVVTQHQLPAQHQHLSGLQQGGASLAKDTVFQRINNRIKTLELNMSLSGQYLEELSRRYRRQMEDMSAAFNRTVRQLNEETERGVERDRKQNQSLGILEGRLRNITALVDALLDERSNYHWKLLELHAVLIVLEAIILGIVLAFGYRRLVQGLVEQRRQSEALVQTLCEMAGNSTLSNSVLSSTSSPDAFRKRKIDLKYRAKLMPKCKKNRLDKKDFSPMWQHERVVRFAELSSDDDDLSRRAKHHHNRRKKVTFASDKRHLPSLPASLLRPFPAASRRRHHSLSILESLPTGYASTWLPSTSSPLDNVKFDTPVRRNSCQENGVDDDVGCKESISVNEVGSSATERSTEQQSNRASPATAKTNSSPARVLFCALSSPTTQNGTGNTEGSLHRLLPA